MHVKMQMHVALETATNAFKNEFKNKILINKFEKIKMMQLSTQ